MASRAFQTKVYTPGYEHVEIPFTLIGKGAAAPTLSEGDPNGAYIVSPLTYTSAGVWSFTTVDTYVAVVDADISIALATPAGAWDIMFTGPPTKNANNTFTFNVNVFHSSSATDVPSDGSVIFVRIRMRNSNLTP
jgi:hypothetical protein